MALDPPPPAFLRELRSRSPDETEALGAALAESLPPGAVVALVGELGAGKTCFVRGLGRGLRVSEPVASPTFALMHSYPGRRELHHYDAWLTGRARAFLDAGGVEALLGADVAAVEWAERVAAVLPLPRIELELRHASPTERRLALRVLPDPSGARADLCRALAEACEAACRALPALAEPPAASRVEPPGGSPARSEPRQERRT